MTNYQITVRKVDPILKAKIAQQAKLKSKSINDLMLEMMQKNFGFTTDNEATSGQEPSWKKFIGALDGEDIFDEAFFEEIERVDPAMWK